MKLLKSNKTAAKRTACILTAGMMALSTGLFTACGDKNQGSGSNSAVVDQSEALKTLAYKVTDVPINFELSGNVTCKNNLFYSVSTVYNNEGDNYFSDSSIVVFDASGNTVLTIPAFKQTDPNEYAYISGDVYADDAGNITFVLSYNKYDDEGNSESSNTLYTYDSTGNLVSSVDLSKVVTQEDNDNNRYFNSYIVDSQGNIYISLSTCIRVCDKSGNVLFTTPESNGDNEWLNGLIFTNNGVPAVYKYSYSDTGSSAKLVEIDLNAKGYGKEYELGSSINTIYSGSGDYLCYNSSDTGIVGVRADNLQTESVLNLLNLGIDNSNINSMAVNDDGSFVTVGYDYSGMTARSTLSLITPIDSSEVKEKKVLTLGCFYIDWNIRSQIAEFNKTNEDYTIYATSYSESNDTSDYTAALTKFNNEILAGNVPDILLISSGMPYNSYASKGLFADLYEFMDKDDVYNRDAFMPNVLKAMEKDGKLYEITPSFTVQTYAAKKSLVGDATSLTMDQANQILASMPEGATLTNDSQTMTASNFLSTAITFSNFVDYTNATCNFDSPEFKAILETAKKYPAEIDYDALYNDNPNYWMEQETACRENRALLYSVYFNDFSIYTNTRDAYFGEDISFVGFPGSGASNATGSVISTGSEIAVSSKSKYKDGAWEFIKLVLDNAVGEQDSGNYGVAITSDASVAEAADEAVKRITSQYYGLPVVKSQLQALGQQATIPQTYTDTDGTVQQVDNTYYVGNTEVKVNLITQDEVNMLIDYFSTVDTIARYDESLTDIINEEANNYFKGTKSVDETASLIQSRASIYLSEQY
ncbi:MAG: extracellular solute-binding protein [Ruminococcus sp.]|nr:extracellular solute-binding protein [Ruminococcus sp.]